MKYINRIYVIDTSLVYMYEWGLQDVYVSLKLDWTCFKSYNVIWDDDVKFMLYFTGTYAKQDRMWYIQLQIQCCYSFNLIRVIHFIHAASNYIPAYEV